MCKLTRGDLARITFPYFTSQREGDVCTVHTLRATYGIQFHRRTSISLTMRRYTFSLHGFAISYTSDSLRSNWLAARRGNARTNKADIIVDAVFRLIEYKWELNFYDWESRSPAPFFHCIKPGHAVFRNVVIGPANCQTAISLCRFNIVHRATLSHPTYADIVR